MTGWGTAARSSVVRAGQHIGKIHEGPVAHAQGQVQIPQTDIHIDTEDLVAQGSQGRRPRLR